MAQAVMEAPKRAKAASPQTIRISSKRQITIPAHLYRDMGFTEYAWIERTDEGLLIKPLEVENEDVSLSVLRKLVESGYEGQELLDKYEEVYPRALDFHQKILEAEDDIRAGRVHNAEDVQQEMRAKYGLYRD